MHPELEYKAATFVHEHRASFLPVTSELILCEAVEIARQAGLSREQFKGSAGFVASSDERASLFAGECRLAKSLQKSVTRN